MSQQTTQVQHSPSVADLVDHLARFDGPPEQFLLHLLMVQCRLALAEAGAIVRHTPDGKPEILSVYPPPGDKAATPVWLAHAVEVSGRVIAGGTTVVHPLRADDELYGAAPSQYLVHVPVRGSAGVRGVGSFLIASSDTDVVNLGRERLELSVCLLSLFEMRLTLARRKIDMQRMRQAMEVLAAVNPHERFVPAGMALVNEVAARWEADRVGLGFLQGRYVKLRALSHTDKFTRQMKLVQDVEAAMEECLDQDVEVLHPTGPEASFVNRSAVQLSQRHGPTTVCSLPLRRGDKTVAVLTIERPIDKPFDLEQLETLRLTAELCTARLIDLHEHDKWLGAKLTDETRRLAAKAIGPEHTWIKLLAVGVVLFLLFATLVKGPDRVEAPFVIEAQERRIVPAPFDGYLLTVKVDPGDPVKAGDVLAELDTAELKLRLAAARADGAKFAKQADVAMRDGKTVEVQMAQAEADRVRAEVRLLDYQIERAVVRSPVDGVVMTGDNRRKLGAPLKPGDVLFEVAPNTVIARLNIPDDRVADVLSPRNEKADGTLTGELAAASHPGDYLPFTLERIDPVAVVEDQQNVFKAKARLDAARPWLRPGMEGAAKIDVGRRAYLVLWTRDLVNWVRMKLWI